MLYTNLWFELNYLLTHDLTQVSSCQADHIPTSTVKTTLCKEGLGSIT